jgi:hypothetical protein
MDIKEKPNHRIYVQILRKLTPEQRLLKAIELSELTKELFKIGLRKRFPNLSEQEFHQLYIKRLSKCHNKNY